jgi:hypothetical protein
MASPIIKVRLMLLNALIPMTKAAGKLHAPFTHKKVTGYHYYHLKPQLKPGHVLVARKDGELTNLLIPGEFTHAAMYIGESVVRIDDRDTVVPMVIEAIGDGVVLCDLHTFLMTKDRVGVLQPRFTDEVGMSKAADWAVSKLGMPYDYLFDPGHNAFYCAELAYEAYEQSSPNGIPFTRWETLGIPTVTPQDFVNATEHWHLFWDSQNFVPEPFTRLFLAA